MWGWTDILPVGNNGEGGTGGNADAGDVLLGKTFTNDSGPQTGAMKNNSGENIYILAISAIDNEIETKIINPSDNGYIDNGTRMLLYDDNFLPSNIKKDVDMFGMTGTYNPSLAHSYYANGNVPTVTDNNTNSVSILCDFSWPSSAPTAGTIMARNIKWSYASSDEYIGLALGWPIANGTSFKKGTSPQQTIRMIDSVITAGGGVVTIEFKVICTAGTIDASSIGVDLLFYY